MLPPDTEQICLERNPSAGCQLSGRQGTPALALSPGRERSVRIIQAVVPNQWRQGKSSVLPAGLGDVPRSSCRITCGAQNSHSPYLSQSAVTANGSLCQGAWVSDFAVACSRFLPGSRAKLTGRMCVMAKTCHVHHRHFPQCCDFSSQPATPKRGGTVLLDPNSRASGPYSPMRPPSHPKGTLNRIYSVGMGDGARNTNLQIFRGARPAQAVRNSPGGMNLVFLR